MEKVPVEGCILNCFMWSSLPCFVSFCHSAIPTSCYIFNGFYYLLYLVLRVHDNKWTHSRSSSWRGCNWGTTATEADAVGEEQLKQTQSGCSSVWPRETSAHQRHYSTRWLVHRSRGASDSRRRGKGDETSEAYLPVRLQRRENSRAPCSANMNGSESSSDLFIVKSRRTKGCLQSVDWNTGMA